MIKSIHIENFKLFSNFDLDLNDDLNILVGDNEAGKSTILEAICLALTKRLSGHLIEHELSPYIFNKECVAKYLEAVHKGTKPGLPKILIELYIADSPELQYLRGRNNSRREDHVGVKLEILFNDEFAEEYARLLDDSEGKRAIPSEYYKANWYSFADNSLSARGLPISVFHIDATTIRLQSGADYYIQNIISSGLEPKQRVALAVAYRTMREGFAGQEAIQAINTGLAGGGITEKSLSLCLDATERSSWETGLVPHLDDVPFYLVGKGEQTSLKIMLALERKAKDCNIILVEEPENHQSFSSMSKLIANIEARCQGKQVLLTTHSAYVLNKLGLEKVILLHDGKTTSFSDLPTGTENYFKKLAGYDTLRLILAKRAILVEGPSDELVVQKAYMAAHGGRLPIQGGTDVISVRGLSFARFLDIAKQIRKEVVVVTDNDGDYKKNVEERYAGYSEPYIKICASKADAHKTLEPQMLAANGLDALNAALGTSYRTEEELLAFMISKKTEWALRVFETDVAISFPQYILDAVQ